MIRLALRQFRTQAAVAIGGLAIVAAIVAATHPHLVDLYDTTIVGCQSRGNCETASMSFLQADRALRGWLGVLIAFVPALIGVFWGAPLVAREIEAGTHRLAWTQSVSRTRWVATKLGVVGVASMVVAGLLSLMVTWWAGLFDRAGADLYGTFDLRDVVPVGYAAFAFAVGVTAGAVLRRTLPAMATTLVIFFTVRLAFAQWIRPGLLAPSHKDFPLGPETAVLDSSGIQPNPPDLPNAWVHAAQIVDGSGKPITPQYVDTACPDLGSLDTIGPPAGGGPTRTKVPIEAQDALHDCITKIGAKFHGVTTYHPASRYWELQWLELAVHLGAAAVLATFCVWWVRRRLG